MASEWKEVLSEAAEEVGIEYEPLEQTSTQIPEPEVKQDELEPAQDWLLKCDCIFLTMLQCWF